MTLQDLEQYIGKYVEFDSIPYDSPLFTYTEEELNGRKLGGHIRGILEKNTGTLSHYSIRMDNGEGIALVDDQVKWIFNFRVIDNEVRA